MHEDVVDASPAKRFFVEMLIRDIRLEDAVLDLVDNAIDSLIRLQKIDLDSFVTSTVIPDHGVLGTCTKHEIVINTNDGRLQVKDNCGGIKYEEAVNNVFRFGAPRRYEDKRLSVYGIGLKRAVFKIGRSISVESRTLESGFRVDIDVEEFVKSSEDWTFPIVKLEPATDPDECGTTITVHDILDESARRLNSPSFTSNLNASISQSYSLFLEKVVTVWMNDRKVYPSTIAISSSDEIQPSLRKVRSGLVSVTIAAGLQVLDKNNEWKGNTAGWYFICNGRVVVFADKTELSGWHSKELPSFQPKHRGFIGIVLFLSEDPESLPWTTTKRGINSESAVFQEIKELMIADARSVVRFLDKRYSKVPISSENTDDLQVRDKNLQDALKSVPVSGMFGQDPHSFLVSPAIRKRNNRVISSISS